MVFCLLLKLGKNTGKSISKNLNGKCRQKLLDHAKQSPTDAKKKGQFKKQQKQLAIWLVVKLLTKLQEFQKNHDKVIQKQLQMCVIKKYIPRERQKIIDNLIFNIVA